MSDAIVKTQFIASLQRDVMNVMRLYVSAGQDTPH